MTAEDKKDVFYVVRTLLIISLLVVSGSIINFHILDVVYLVIIGVYFLDYLHQKKKHQI